MKLFNAANIISVIRTSFIKIRDFLPSPKRMSYMTFFWGKKIYNFLKPRVYDIAQGILFLDILIFAIIVVLRLACFRCFDFNDQISISIPSIIIPLGGLLTYLLRKSVKPLLVRLITYVLCVASTLLLGQCFLWPCSPDLSAQSGSQDADFSIGILSSSFDRTSRVTEADKVKAEWVQRKIYDVAKEFQELTPGLLAKVEIRDIPIEKLDKRNDNRPTFDLAIWAVLSRVDETDDSYKMNLRYKYTDFGKRYSMQEEVTCMHEMNPILSDISILKHDFRLILAHSTARRKFKLGKKNKPKIDSVLIMESINICKSALNGYSRFEHDPFYSAAFKTLAAQNYIEIDSLPQAKSMLLSVVKENEDMALGGIFTDQERIRVSFAKKLLKRIEAME